MDAGGADATLLPQRAGGPVQAAFGQVVLDQAEDVGRFDRQELLGRCSGGGSGLAGAFVVRDHGGGPFVGHLRGSFGSENEHERNDGQTETRRRAFSSFPPIIKILRT